MLVRNLGQVGLGHPKWGMVVWPCLEHDVFEPLDLARPTLSQALHPSMEREREEEGGERGRERAKQRERARERARE